MRRHISLLVLGLAAFSLGACNGKPATDTAQTPAPARAANVVTAKYAAWPRIVSVPGTVSAVNVATLASRTGGRVTRVEVDAGTHVAKGTVLADVGIADARDQLAQARANLATAKATFNQAAADEQRYHALYSTHVTSAQQYETVHRTYLAAKAKVAAATSALTTAKSNLNYAEIRAPFTGVIASKNVKVGDFAGPGAPLFVITGDVPEIRAHVGPSTFSTLKVGDQADVVINGSERPAVVTLIDASADPSTRTHLIELHLRDSRAAPYGVYADVRLRTGQTPVVAVPATALVRRAGLLGVFVVDKDNRAQFRLVRAGQRQGDHVAIIAGLAVGEKVIATPVPGLMNDTPIASSRPLPPISG